MPLKLTDTIEEPDINLTPMIDIVFLLIIFFMVGTQFSAQERQFDIELPSVSSSQPLTNLPDELVVNVRRDGTILLGEEQQTLPELQAALIQAKANYADQAVVLRGEGEGPYQYMMDVVAACQHAEIKSISLAYRVKSEDE